MSINGITKGKGAEREIAKLLNASIEKVFNENNVSLPEQPIVQRNQNQSAVGGADLIGTFGFAIEVKRQENLSINTWWAQTMQQAVILKQHPVLMYKQNYRPWLVVTMMAWWTPRGSLRQVRVTMSLEDFLEIFELAVYESLSPV